mmetsp:Transcript_54863/g.130664  ORF Transcript_54863/g.130664 Transcript_54863/m.130664 type:complete len:242 (-) Transcript_54863:400-1125(-)
MAVVTCPFASARNDARRGATRGGALFIEGTRPPHSAQPPAPVESPSALHDAASKGHLLAVLLQIQNGAEVSSRENDGRTPLHRAALGGHEAVLLHLLEHGAEVSAKTICGVTPQLCSAQEGHTLCCAALLEHGSEVSAKDICGYTSLHWAAQGGHAAVAQQLLDKGASLSAQDCFGKTPMEVASSFAGSLPHLQIAGMIKAEAIRRAKCVAFAMGQEERLGEGSWARELDPGVLRMVLDQV